MIWSIISGFFTSSLSNIAKDLKEAYLSKQNAVTEEQRIAAEERIKTLEVRKEVILKAQSDPHEKWIRILWAVPMLIYTWKLIIWDKILEWGATDNLSPDLWNIYMIVLAGYFVDVAIRRIKS